MPVTSRARVYADVTHLNLASIGIMNLCCDVGVSTQNIVSTKAIQLLLTMWLS